MRVAKKMLAEGKIKAGNAGSTTGTTNDDNTNNMTTVLAQLAESVSEMSKRIKVWEDTRSSTLTPPATPNTPTTNTGTVPPLTPLPNFSTPMHPISIQNINSPMMMTKSLQYSPFQSAPPAPMAPTTSSTTATDNRTIGRTTTGTGTTFVWPVDINTEMQELSAKIYEVKLTIESPALAHESAPALPAGGTSTVFAGSKEGKASLQRLLSICELPWIEDADLAKVVLPTLASFTAIATGNSRGANDDDKVRMVINNWLMAVNDSLVVLEVNKLVVNRWWLVLLQLKKLQPYVDGTITNSTTPLVTQADVNGLHKYLHNLVTKLYRLVLMAATGENQVLPSIRAEVATEQDATAGLTTGTVNIGNTGTYIFGDGNVNYLWRRIASNYFRRTVNTTINLSRELESITYDTSTAGGNVVNMQCILDLYNQFDLHIAKRRLFNEPVDESGITTRLLTLVPPDITNVVDFYLLNNRNNATLAGVKDLINSAAINFLARSNTTTFPVNFAGMGNGRTNSGSGTGGRASGRPRCEVCLKTNHTTNEHRVCSTCGKPHSTSSQCRNQTGTSTNGSGSAGKTPGQ
jgi:hypothetical protein